MKDSNIDRSRTCRSELHFVPRCWQLSDLDDLLRQWQPSLVIVPEFSRVALSVLRRSFRGGFRVVSLCDDSLDMIRGNDFGWKHRVARLLLPRFFHTIILPGEEVAQWYRARFGKGVCMPIIPDERRFREKLSAAVPRARALRRQYLSSGKPVVGCVGRMVALKNIPTLLEAFLPFRQQAELVFVGDGDKRLELERQASEAGVNAVFTGYLTGTDLLAWYLNIDVLVLPSLQEAYGAVTAEALLSGAQVVVSERAGSAVLVESGKNGYLFNPLSPMDLSSKLDTILRGIPVRSEVGMRENLLGVSFQECFDALLSAL